MYINGVKAAVIDGYSSTYSIVQLTSEGKSAMVTGGKNVIAIHCKQISGGQFIDAGISLLKKTKS